MEEVTLIAVAKLKYQQREELIIKEKGLHKSGEDYPGGYPHITKAKRAGCSAFSKSRSTYGIFQTEYMPCS